VLRLLHLAHADSIPVFVGSSVPLQPTRPFPQAWIDASEQFGRTAAPPASRRLRASGAADFLARRITSDSSVELLLLGPLTNIALAIRRAGRNHVLPLRAVMMGGAVNVPGNLPAPEMQTDNTKAEWNVYSDPVAAAEVFGSALRIEMIGLDATNQVRIDTAFVRQFRAGPVTPMRAYVSRVLDAAHEWIVTGAYYAWDPLAAVALLDSDVVRRSSMPLTVDVSGRFPGWTHRATAGHAVAVAISADRARFMRDFAARAVSQRP
jgi:inosine-uridine nucleoside N-ribohydrolase